jgi:DNA-binding LytR/AlgR family response regulator
MNKIKIAVLEDSQELLKDLIVELRATNMVDVVEYDTNSDTFIEKINNRNTEIDALILDIDLGGPITGLDIAHKFQLPTLFISGNTTKYNIELEDLDLENKYYVDKLRKPISTEKLKIKIERLVDCVRKNQEINFARLTFSDNVKNIIHIDTIVFLETETGNNGSSSNKIIYFTNRKPEKLIDFSYTKMEEKGLNSKTFITPNQSFRVNVNKIKKNSTQHIYVMAIDKNGMINEFEIKVSENYRANVKKILM